MTTNARTFTADSAHWYYTDGRPCYELEKKDGKGMKSPTLADARKLNLLPGVTTILRILDKPNLNDWKIEQAVLAVVSSKQRDGETLDEFIHRVLHVERIQDQETEIARDKGTDIHAAIEDYFLGKEVAQEWQPWVMPAALEIAARGQIVATERILTGVGFAGKTDLIQEAPDCFWIYDWKSAKTLPDAKKGGAWLEHRLQLSAYAASFSEALAKAAVPGAVLKPVRTSNVYISTIEQGKYVVCDHENDWQTTFEKGFKPLVTHWQWRTSYTAKQ